MRGPALISAFLHVGLAVFMVVGLPSFTKAPEPGPPVIVPIDLVVIADKTEVPTERKQQAEEKQETRKEEPKPEPKRVEQPKPRPPEPKAERVPPPPKQVEEKKPEPEPEPEVAEKKPDPAPATQPRTKPKPPPEPKQVEKEPEPEKPAFDETRIAALLNKLVEEQPQAEVAEDDQKQQAEEAPSNQRISLADQATATEKDFLQQQIQNCWSIPSGVPYSDDLFAVVTVRLNRDGTYAGPIRVDNPGRMNAPGQQFYRTFVESAVRAVQKCEPLRMPVRNGVPFVPKEDVEFAFDPRQLLGG